MDKMRKDKNEKDVSVLAEEMLKSYADSWAEAYADEAEELLRDDEQYQKAAAKYENYKHRNVKKRVLRCAAIIICAVFLASVAIPIPQAHAWRVWWLDLVTGQNHQDIDVRAGDEYLGEYYVSELPEGFEVVSERKEKGQYTVTYMNAVGESLLFTQSQRMSAEKHFDNETTDYSRELIGDFEVLVGENESFVIFEITTDKNFIVVNTNASYDVGKFFIEKLREI